MDCEASCPKPPPTPPIPKPFSIGGLDGYAIIMLIVFLVGSALFLLGVCVFPSKRSIGRTMFTVIRMYFRFVNLFYILDTCLKYIYN